MSIHILVEFKSRKQSPKNIFFIALSQDKEQTPTRVSVLFLASKARFELAIYDCDPTSVARWVSKAQMIEYHLCFAVSPQARAGRAECKRSVEAIDRDTRRRLGGKAR